MKQANGEYVTFMDSDDWSHPQRLERQLNEFEKTDDAVGVINNYFRVNLEGNIVIISGKVLRQSCISLMIKAEVIDEIGFFDSLRVGADSEYIERIQAFFGYNALVKMDSLAIISNYSDSSLTGGGDFAITWRGITGARLINRNSWQIWHKKLRKGSKMAYVGFPLLTRPYDAPKSMLA